MEVHGRQFQRYRGHGRRAPARADDPLPSGPSRHGRRGGAVRGDSRTGRARGPSRVHRRRRSEFDGRADRHLHHGERRSRGGTHHAAQRRPGGRYPVRDRTPGRERDRPSPASCGTGEAGRGKAGNGGDGDVRGDGDGRGRIRSSRQRTGSKTCCAATAPPFHGSAKAFCWQTAGGSAP